MAIDKTGSVEDPNLESILSGMAQDATGILYTDTVPTAATTPPGKMVIYDNGTTKRIYFKTGKDNLGYVGLT